MNHKETTMKAFDKLKIPSGAFILDVGCRSEEQGEDLRIRGHRWVGCDIKGSKGIVECDMHNLPFPEIFDLIFCCHTLEHAENPTQVLRQFKKVLKHKGLIFISTPKHCEKQILDTEDSDHISVFTNLQLKKLFEYCNIELISQWYEANENGLEQNECLITIGQVTKHG